MSDRFKQRLVGALVLIALAVVFLPVLFNLEPRRPMDETSRIPPAPDIEPAKVSPPREPEVTSQPPAHEDVFQPEEAATAGDGSEDDVGSADASDTPPEKRAADDNAPRSGKQAPQRLPEVQSLREQSAETEKAPDTEAPETEPGLTESGLPEAWVVQAASYEDADSADALTGRLQEAGFKAFVRPATVGGRRVHRVYVGPLVLKQRAEEQKERIDASLDVDSLILPYEP